MISCKYLMKDEVKAQIQGIVQEQRVSCPLAASVSPEGRINRM